MNDLQAVAAAILQQHGPPGRRPPLPWRRRTERLLWHRRPRPPPSSPAASAPPLCPHAPRARHNRRRPQERFPRPGGRLVPADPASELPGQPPAYRGRYATWGAYLDACIAKYIFAGPLISQARSIRDLYLAQGTATDADLAKVAARLESAKR